MRSSKYILLTPSLILFILFVGWPLIEVARQSFLKTNFIITEFVGLANYLNTLNNPEFLLSIKTSLIYMGLLIPGQVIPATFISLLAFDLSKRWQDIVRIVFYIPTLSAGVIIGQVWKWIYHQDGPINWIISKLGGKPVAIFSNPVTAIPSIALVVASAGLGGHIIILLSNMMGINKELFDAAKVDGAKPWQIKLFIILPMVKSTIIMLSVLSGIAALQIIETIMVLAPYDYTATMTYHIYREGFIFSKYGMSSAQALILMFATIVLTLGKNRITRNAE
jgi:putative chitobiose transport system permease protein